MLGEVDVPTMRLGCQSKLFSAGPFERLFLKGVEGLSDYLCPVEIFWARFVGGVGGLGCHQSARGPCCLVDHP